MLQNQEDGENSCDLAGKITDLMLCQIVKSGRLIWFRWGELYRRSRNNTENVDGGLMISDPVLVVATVMRE
jgi:hypothetical protein